MCCETNIKYLTSLYAKRLLVVYKSKGLIHLLMNQPLFLMAENGNALPTFNENGNAERGKTISGVFPYYAVHKHNFVGTPVPTIFTFLRRIRLRHSFVSRTVEDDGLCKNYAFPPQSADLGDITVRA